MTESHQAFFSVHHINPHSAAHRAPVMFFSVVVTVLATGAFTRVSGSCSREEPCLGGRPRTALGCCPVASGDNCGTATGVECDTELGFRCLDLEGHENATHGYCTGRYGLHAPDIQPRSVSLEWVDFKPVNYPFEYVLLYRQDTYTAVQSDWIILDIGVESEYTLTKLSPGTLYFIQVAVWEESDTSVLGNASEVIWLTTRSVTYCNHNGEQFPVGQITENCEDRCRCLPSGEMDCVPLCPETEMPEVREGCYLRKEEECSCEASEHCPNEGASCEFEGQEYESGFTVTLGCRSCLCSHGTMSCHYPEHCEVLEASDTCTHPIATPDPEGGCCPIWHCEAGPAEVEEECNHNGTNHRLGETFVHDCSLCTCVRDNNISCSFNTCPPVQLPLPSLLCPFPHVRRDGCCDTVFCMHANIDRQTLMSRMMAISFGPSTMIISFDVDHTDSSEESSSSTSQDRYEVMTSDRGGDPSSWSSRTYTPTTINAADDSHSATESPRSSSSPADLLQNDAAIRVDDRVFITVGGLRPNTTYYFRVRTVVKSDMGKTKETVDNATLTGYIVARTLEPEKTCVVKNKTFKDGSVVSKSCEEVCTCTEGHVRCQSACSNENVVMAPSPSCPRPKLVQSDESSCCKTWKCFPEEDGCSHGNIFLKNGEEVYEGPCEKKCRCTNGEVICTPVCLPPTPAPRSAKCALTNVTGTCCPVWMCSPDSKPPLEVSLSTRVGFQGLCLDEDKFKLSLKKAFTDRLAGHLPCADRESHHFVMCFVKHVIITCPTDSYRRRRQTTEIEIVAVVTANVTESNTLNKIQASLNATGSVLLNMFSTHDIFLVLDNGENVTSSGKVQFFGVSFDCEPDFIFRNNACVPEFLFSPSAKTPRHNVTMSLANSTYNSASLTWSSVSASRLTYVTGLIIQYRETTSQHWNQSVILPPSTTHYTVMYLRASSSYKARLVALTKWTSQPQLYMSMVTFTTKNHDVLTGSLEFDPLQVSLGLTSVTISWPSFAPDVADAIAKMKITFRKSLDTAHVVTFHDVDPHKSDITMNGLTSKTAYVTKFVVVLTNGTTITSHPLHFVTLAEDTSSAALVPLLATCIVIVLLVVLISVAFFTWRRMRRKSLVETAFENKAYGLNITSLCSTRAKNDSARPQDLEGGGSTAVPADATDAGDCTVQA